MDPAFDVTIIGAGIVVLALAREGYAKGIVSLPELMETLASEASGTWPAATGGPGGKKW